MLDEMSSDDQARREDAEVEAAAEEESDSAHLQTAPKQEHVETLKAFCCHIWENRLELAKNTAELAVWTGILVYLVRTL